MINKKDILIIGIISILLTVIGFILDLNERIPNILLNIYEILIMSAIIFILISIIYFPVKLIIYKFRKSKF
jgi:heme/copper-type cytochrome/quinol oxidase subunit 4